MLQFVTCTSLLRVMWMPSVLGLVPGAVMDKPATCTLLQSGHVDLLAVDDLQILHSQTRAVVERQSRWGLLARLQKVKQSQLVF